jgi:hypothetical protein
VLAFLVAACSAGGPAHAQLQFFTSLDRQVAAVGESFLLKVELLATVDDEADLVLVARAIDSLEVGESADNVEVVRILGSKRRTRTIDGYQVEHFTKKIILKVRRAGLIEIPSVRLPIADLGHPEGTHSIVVYDRSAHFHAARRSVVPLVVESRIGDRGERRFIGTGSGFTVADNVLVTAYHVIVNADKVVASLPNGKKLTIKQVWTIDPVRDVAVLRVDPRDIREAGLVPLEIAPRDFQTGPMRSVSQVPKVVFTAGWPGGVQKSQAGVLFAVNRYYDDEAIWLSSNFVRPGDSGGPLIDQDGRVIGVVSYAMSGRHSGSQPLENVATSTDPRPALARRRLRRKPVSLSEFRKSEFFERNPHAVAAKVAATLSEFGDPRGRQMIGGLDPFLDDLERAVAEHRNESRLYFIKGSVYQMLGEVEDAKTAYEQALVHRPYHFPSAYSLAYCQMSLRSYETAAQLFTFISGFEPYENLALYGLAQADLQLLRYERAADNLRRLIHDHPEFGPAQFLLGRAFLGLGEYAKAAQVQIRLEVIDAGWADLLNRIRNLTPLKPVRRYSMPEARLRLLDPEVRDPVRPDPFR